MTATAYPLSWPETFPRTPAHGREKGKFKTEYRVALNNVATSLRLFGSESGKKIVNPVLSSDVDPNPLAEARTRDPGVAVWFVWDNLQVCIAVDRYQTAAANLQAIHHILEARRTELRHGTLNLVRATFHGFKALPAPHGEEWWNVLGVAATASISDIDAAWREKAKTAHPDRGGTQDAMARLNAARDKALKMRAA